MMRTEDDLVEKLTFVSSRGWQQYLVDYLSIFWSWWSVRYLQWTWQIPGMSAALLIQVHIYIYRERGRSGFLPNNSTLLIGVVEVVITSFHTFVLLYRAVAGVLCFRLSNQSFIPQKSSLCEFRLHYCTLNNTASSWERRSGPWKAARGVSLSLSFSPSLPLSAFPVFFCVPGPGLLTLASSCVVLLPEGTVLGSTNSSNSWGGKSGIKGCVVCMGVKRIIFVCLFFQKAFLFWSIISNFIQRHHPFHVWCQQKWWMEWSLFPFFSHLLTSNQTLLQQLCNYFFLQILKWKLFQKCWPITDCKKKFSYIIPVWTSCSD